MSEIQEVDVLVKPDGTVQIEVRGVKGQKCLTLTESVEKLLGGEVLERVHTDEFHEPDQQQTRTEQQEQTG